MARTTLLTAGARTSGFDYLRLVLACAVAVSHYGAISEGTGRFAELWSGPARPFFQALLPMFFALSGFLVSGSLERSKTLTGFLGLRVIRIIPALFVEVVLSALILGPIVTQFTLHAYFTDTSFFQYFQNIVGRVHMTLPGVFLDNPAKGIVNGQLWTIPWEFDCYLVLSVLALIGVNRWRWLAPLAAVVITLVSAARVVMAQGFAFEIFPAALPGVILLISFLFGVSIYLYRDTLTHDRNTVWIYLVLALAALSASAFRPLSLALYLAPFPIAYLTVLIGLKDPRRLPFMEAADYSYGIFLYHWAIAQTVVHFMPGHGFLFCLIVSFPITVAFSALSWHLVEKPAQRLRHGLRRIEAALPIPILR